MAQSGLGQGGRDPTESLPCPLVTSVHRTVFSIILESPQCGRTTHLLEPNFLSFEVAEQSRNSVL